MQRTQLMRSQSDKVVGGVSGGLGDYFNVDPVWFRLGFVFLTLTTGIGLLAYGALWLALPSTTGRAWVQQAVTSAQQAGQRMTASFNTAPAQPRYDAQTGQPLAPAQAPNQKLGVVLMGIGALMLASFLNVTGPMVALALLGGGWYLLRKS